MRPLAVPERPTPRSSTTTLGTQVPPLEAVQQHAVNLCRHRWLSELAGPAAYGVNAATDRMRAAGTSAAAKRRRKRDMSCGRFTVKVAIVEL